MHLKELLVLLVEPSSTQQRIIQRQLSQLGIEQIVTVKTGQEALHTMRTDHPDLAISTLYLPDMTGTDLVHTMRNDPDLEKMAFMLISSETRFRYLDPIRQAGAVAILPKPFKPAELRIAMNSVLEYIDPTLLELDNFCPEDLKVLVVDDSSMARKHISRVLNVLGIEHIREARDGREAVEIIANNYFDLVVTDYNMPNMDGKELVDHIRTASNQASIPVLMVTSEANESRLAAVQQSGVSAICDKPFETSVVRDLVQMALSEA
ncbi:response regulator [Candidatus Thiodiazotropha sp. CDECU1]|uniref:response regulator n=1 Tax=Candidatus Thiodiazotropha sp. CDECU1 TaxID=3065865 RepID=UPI0029308EC3|nr:response regulator [Candidatus Thiodiazotropha sp. CDECU1]